MRLRRGSFVQVFVSLTTSQVRDLHALAGDHKAHTPSAHGQHVARAFFSNASVRVGARTNRQVVDGAAPNVLVVFGDEGKLCFSTITKRHVKTLTRIRRTLEPTGRRLGNRIGPGDVGFDVEDRRAVEEIHLCEVEREPLTADKANHGEADGIRSTGRARRKHTAPEVTSWRKDRGPKTVSAVEHGNEPQVVEALNVTQRILKPAPGLEFKSCFNVLRRASLTRRIRLVPKLRTNKPDGAKTESGSQRSTGNKR